MTSSDASSAEAVLKSTKSGKRLPISGLMLTFICEFAVCLYFVFLKLGCFDIYRQMSGATIKIANADEGCTDRKVTISGPPETINAANYLINAR